MLTATQRQLIRGIRDLDARRRAVQAGAKIHLDPRDRTPNICEATTEAGGRCTNQVHEGHAICGVHRRQLAA